MKSELDLIFYGVVASNYLLEPKLKIIPIGFELGLSFCQGYGLYCLLEPKLKVEPMEPKLEALVFIRVVLPYCLVRLVLKVVPIGARTRGLNFW